MKLRIKATALALCAAMALTTIPYVPASATQTTLDRINQKKQEKQQTEQEKQKIQNNKDQKDNELGQLSYAQGELKNQINTLNDELAQAGAALEELESEIDAKEAEIEATLAELEEAKQTQSEHYEAMKKRVQAMYEQPAGSYFTMFVKCESIGDIINAADYIKMISDYDSRLKQEYDDSRSLVEAKEAALEAEKAELDSLKEQNLAEQQRINDVIKTTAEYVAAYGEQISGVKKELAGIENELAAKNAELAAQEADLAALQKQYEEELRMSALAASSAKRDISEVSFEEGDRYLLANLIYCEAGGESYEGQLAVGAVVINRVLSSVYPDTVSGVIYQYKQFSPVLDGHLALALASNKATESCYKAADEAMAGTTNVGGCVYFRTPREGLSGISIGGHIFY